MKKKKKQPTNQQNRKGLLDHLKLVTSGHPIKSKQLKSRDFGPICTEPTAMA